MTEEELGLVLSNEISALKERKKSVIEPVWEQIAPVLIPELSDFDGSKTIDALMAPGYYDGKPRAYLEITANAIFSLMCGPGTNWIQFNSAIPEIQEDQESREYFDVLRTLVLKTMSQDGFYDIAKPAIKYAMAMGTACVTVTSEPEEKKLDFVLWHPGDFCNSMGKDKRTDAVLITQKAKIIDLSSYDALPQKYIDKIKEGKGDEEVELYFYCKKNKDESENLVGGKFPYTLYHILESGEIIHYTGMHTLPGSMWLYEKSARLEYGLCPGYYILRDILQSNKIRKYTMMEMEKEVRPPLWVPETSAGKFFTDPGSINYHNGDPNNFPRRVHERADLSNANMVQTEITDIVRSHLMVDFFQSLTMKTNRKTAAEVQGLQQEMGAQAAPLVYSVEHNFLKPLVKRTLILLQEKGMLPEPPPVIQRLSKDFALELEFMGPLSQANRYLYKTQQAHRILNEAIMPIANFDPEGIKDALDTKAFLKLAVDGIGGGFKILRTDAEIEERVNQRQAAAQQQAKMQQQQALMANGGKAPEEGSILSQAMGSES